MQQPQPSPEQLEKQKTFLMGAQNLCGNVFGPMATQLALSGEEQGQIILGMLQAAYCVFKLSPQGQQISSQKACEEFAKITRDVGPHVEEILKIIGGENVADFMDYKKRKAEI